MKFLIVLLALFPSFAVAQLRVASANPLSGEVVVITGDVRQKMEKNHWLKSNDLLSSGQLGKFQVFIGASSFDSKEETLVQVLSSKELEILKGCLLGDFHPEIIIRKESLSVSSERPAKGLVCYANKNLFVVAMDGELEIKDKNETLGKTQEESYRVYSFHNKELSLEKVLSPFQFLELEGKKNPSELMNLLSYVPYGLSGKVVANDNAVLLEEMFQIDSDSRKFNLSRNAKEKGGEELDLKNGKILRNPLHSYYDSHQGVSYFLPKEKVPLPVKQDSRSYFFRESYQREVTGGVRGIFDPQRLDGGTP